MHIFMTGGAGFLGRAVMRYYQSERPDWTFTIYSRDEAKHMRARSEFPQHSYILGDVQDLDRLTVAMTGADRVIHAAAMKYVPQGETDVQEAINVNVDGSRNVVKAALRNRVHHVLGISTDKACNPQNVYGITKRLMERQFQEAALWVDETNFSLVRYGNVVGSTGSVVPLFRQQAREGRVTLTDGRMTRFWLSVMHAVELIERAFRINDTANQGIIIVPRLAACDMRTVAEAAISVECDGHMPKMGSVKVEELGHRPGEKLHEELLSKNEALNAKNFDGLMVVYPPVLLTPQEPGLYYTSATPDRKLTKDDYIKLINEVPV